MLDLLSLSSLFTPLSPHEQPITFFKQILIKGNTQLEQAFKQGIQIEKIVEIRSQFIDRLLSTAWHYHQLASFDNTLCLIATGGYGRKELFPYSDIDVLILSSHSLNFTLQEAIEKFITLLWDIGLEVGHSVRTLEECVTLATEDVISYTNLLDGRLLLGDEALFSSLMASILGPQAIWSCEVFFTAKIAEQTKRYEKYGHSSYNLEPNIKEGPGGLRDIQTIIWVAKQKFAIKSSHDLVTYHFLTEDEYLALQKIQFYLWEIRTALHHLTKRNEHRLLFDYQKELTKQFNFSDTLNELAIEQFMKNYYRNVKELNELNDMLLQYFDETILNLNTVENIIRINDRFHIVNQYIEVSHHHVFNESPAALIEIFLLVGQLPEIKGIRASTIRLIKQNRHLVSGYIEQNDYVKKIFLDIFKLPANNIAKPLRLMSRYGILGRYLPDFEFLIGKMQYDLYHVNTVDRHLIATVQQLYSFTLEESKEKFPLCHEIIYNIPSLKVLYLAGLFHDIGKGRGKNHSKVGMEITQAFCKAHYLNIQQTELLCWLVDNHLFMSNTAQRKDIYDPDIIIHFAEKVGNSKQLNYLYLLTCADIIATNENLWNNWRASLLRDLYLATQTLFTHQKRSTLHNAASLITITKQEALLLLLEQDKKQIRNLWSQWGKRYFLHHSAKKIAWHTVAILNHAIKTEPLILISPYKNEGGTEIFIYIKDKPFVFANTAAVLDKLHLNVVEAQIITTQDGYTLDSYIVIDQQGHTISDDPIKNAIVHAIRQQFLSHKPLLSINRRQLTRRQRHFSYPSHINFKQDEKKKRTHLEIISPDRPGLLARIGLAFKECNINLQHAKITTLGDRVEDIFYITDCNHNPITTHEAQEKLAKTLRYYLEKT